MSVRRRPPTERIVPATGLTRYDLLLAALPVPLLTGLLVALSTDLPTAVGVATGSLGSAALLGYGLFVAAPTDDERMNGSFAPSDD